MSLFPATATRDARILVAARSLWGFADGVVGVILADYLRSRSSEP